MIQPEAPITRDSKHAWSKPLLESVEMKETAGPIGLTCDGAGALGTGSNSNMNACFS